MESSPGANSRVMDVIAEPTIPQASDAETVGNLTYIEGDVLHMLLDLTNTCHKKHLLYETIRICYVY